MDMKEQAYIVFNSDGKLLQVEYGLEAVYNSYQIVTLNAGIAIVCVSKRVPVPKLCAETHTSIYKIADNIYFNITGLPADIDYVVGRARTLAASLEYSLGCTLTPDIFARALSEKFQLMVQRSGKRAPAFACAIFGFENGQALLHYTDISAVEYPCYAMVSGEDYSKMTKYIEKRIKPQQTVYDLIDIGVSTLLESIGKDAEHTEIEVAMLTKDGLIHLSGQEIVRVLQTINERQ